jgi:hypothetical protein
MQKLKETGNSQNAGRIYIYKKSVWTGMLGSKKTICMGKRGCVVALM